MIDFGPNAMTSSPPHHLPIKWHEDSLWFLAALNTPGYGVMFSKPGTFQWKAVRNWNRSPLKLMRLTQDMNAAVDVNPPHKQFAWSSVNSKGIELWHGHMKVRTFKESKYHNRYNEMTPVSPTLISLSPDGNRLAASFQSLGLFGCRIAFFDTQTGRQIALESAVEGCFTDFAWSPDNRELAAIAVDGWVTILNAQSGKQRLKFRAHQLFGAQIAWAPDGKTLVTASNPRVAWSPTHVVFNFKSGSGVDYTGGTFKSTIGGRVETIISEAPDGTATFNGRTERQLKRFDATTGKLIGAPLTLETGAVDLAFSPDGKQLALGEHEFALVLDAHTLTTQRRLKIPPSGHVSSPPFAPVCVAWSPEGATLATSTERGVTLWRIH